MTAKIATVVCAAMLLLMSEHPTTAGTGREPIPNDPRADEIAKQVALAVAEARKAEPKLKQALQECVRREVLAHVHTSLGEDQVAIAVLRKCRDKYEKWLHSALRMLSIDYDNFAGRELEKEAIRSITCIVVKARSQLK